MEFGLLGVCGIVEAKEEEMNYLLRWVDANKKIVTGDCRGPVG